MCRTRPPASRRPHGGGRNSFTVPELLVVVGIISILIALLFPVLGRARRGAIVLACPIAYVGEDGGLYLTNEIGSAELRISPPGWRAESRWALESPVAWSPSGQFVAFGYSARDGSGGGWAFMDVYSGATSQTRGRFCGWVDNHTALATGSWGHEVFDIHTGQTVTRFTLPINRHYDTFAAVPATCDGAYVASWHGDTRPTIGLVRKDFGPAHPIATWGNYGDHNHLTPQVDPTGQWVAWSWHGVVYLHSMRDHSRVAPTPVPMPGGYQYAEFCDWTGESRLLVNVMQNGRGALLVLEPDGRLVRQIPLTVPPVPMSVAAYRKYEPR